MLDFKLALSVLAAIITIIGFIPYFKDIFNKMTRPHIYTWLIWAMTQSTATLALWYGGGSFAVLSLVTGTILVILVFLLCFKYGTKNITRNDTLCLIIALFAVVAWWQLKNPFLSVFLVSAIDGLGYIPTYRKSWTEPWSETLSYWALMALTAFMTIVASAEYNFLTITYLSVLTLSNITVFTICYFRRKNIINPSV
ncbi:MAG: hypothetical protein JWP09_60 [Candidatus Taylorbacteria bacterium]|nr:hypothetical protein [Candidatus Taylorbacteria bacterium]